jgi:hypothetical protein
VRPRRGPWIAAALVACAVAAALVALLAIGREENPTFERKAQHAEELTLAEELEGPVGGSSSRAPARADGHEAAVAPRTSASWPPPEPRHPGLVVRVLQDGLPQQGLTVEANSGRTRQTTDAAGEARFPPPYGDAVQLVDGPDVFFHAKIADMPRVERDGQILVTVELQAGGAAEILVVSPDGVPVAGFLVDVFFQFEDPREREGVITRRARFTDRRGIVRFERLAPGRWETSTFESRSWRLIELHELHVQRGGVAFLRATAEKERFERRIEFQVLLPEDAQCTEDGEGRCLDFHFQYEIGDDERIRAGSLFVDDGGALATGYAKTGSSERVMLRIVTGDTEDEVHVLTEWIEVPTGRDLGLLQFQWL